jgi:alpha-tubulin suppressor-like RCC1 family protein/serine/threonine protein kinase/tetratricopeptide (TPR) repeat protein
LEQLFHEVLELPSAEERAEYLSRACAGDTALRERVEKLLRAHVTAGQFLSPDTPAPAAVARTETEIPGTEKVGDRIGNYTLVKRIGEGGWCVVYLAEQALPIRRQVALKLIKPGMDTRQVVARFETERQALALMDHPAIAKVFDAGVTTTGRPYFVMELVRGIPITQYCDQNRLTVNQRLELFTSVCHAVQHAHQKGVIHRDLKPSNILVTSQSEHSDDSRLGFSEIEGAGGPENDEHLTLRRTPTNHDLPLPKIIDFGIAKAVQSDLADRAAVTWVGQFLGTPAYMSPEQGAMRNQDVDVRSDIYSLGALLYELLTGTTPLSPATLAEAGFEEILRQIQETEPSKPSASLHASREGLPEAATARQADPRALQRRLRGDLDWIVMKALEKDPTRRYATANDFVEDIQRHLAHEPVLAGPPSALYRGRKFVRRHRMGVVLGAAASLALLVGLSLALVGLQRARRAEVVARRDRDHAVQAEEQMRRERDRAIQAEADTLGILSLFDERLGANEAGLDLYYAAARLARERLDPRNAAAMNFILPLGKNLGRRGAWRDTLDVYTWLSEASEGNCDLWTQAHAAALAAGQPEKRGQLRTRIVNQFGNARDALTAMQVARAVLIDPDFGEHLQVGLDEADKAFRELPAHPWCRVVQGMAEYRRGRWFEAIDLLQEVEGGTDPGLAALAGCFRAMAQNHAGQTNVARATLECASHRLQRLQRTGVLPGDDWHFVAFALTARAEAENLILGGEVSSVVTMDSLAAARRKWRVLREDLGLAQALSAEGRWDASRDAYVRALDHPAFDWDTAEEESASQCLSLQMSTVFARLGDSANHERLCRILLQVGLAEHDNPATRQVATARAERYARACLSLPLRPNEEIRQAALDLVRFAITNQERQQDHHAGWTSLAGGLAELCAGDPARALDFLARVRSDDEPALRTLALAYRASALKKLNRPAETVQALEKAETLFETAHAPGSTWVWWETEQCDLALQEARSVVRSEATDPGSGMDNGLSLSTGRSGRRVIKTDIMVSPLMKLPPIARDTIAVAAGGRHGLALSANGTVLGWGDRTSGQTSIPPSATNVVAISAGWEHSLALRSNGTLFAWGLNTCGQCDIPSGLTDVVAISAGHYHNLALRADGTVFAWGTGKGKGPFAEFGQSQVPANANHIMAVAAGSYHSLALRTNGTLVAWGLNSSGQCDIPAGATNVIAIAAGHGHNLALKRDGALMVWGNNEFKYNIVGITNIPIEATNIVAIASGAFHCLALRADGRLFAWGLNEQRQCVVPFAANGARVLAAGFLNSLALRRDSTVVAWGANDCRQSLPPPSLSWEHAISDGPDHALALRQDGTVQETMTSTSEDLEVPRVPVLAAATNVVAIATGGSHRLALRTDGTVVAWGGNSYGQSSIPENTTNVTAISAGNNHSLALRGDGTVVAWGSNRHGQTDVPAGLANVAAVAAGYDRNLALRANGTVAAWGSSASVPAGLSNVVAMSVGRDHNLALRSDGTVVAWGSDDRGQCLLPAGLANVVAIAAGDGFGLALTDDGTVVWLGYSLHGFGPFDPRNPTGFSEAAAITRSAVLKQNGEVIGLAPHRHSFAKSQEPVASIAAGASHNLALPLADSHRGWVHGWGDNDHHQAAGADVVYAGPVSEWVPQSWLSDNFVRLESPKLGLLTNAISVSAGDRHSLALRADGTVGAWGDNTDGQASPPAGLSNVVDIAAGGAHSLALTVEGTVVGWGNDGSGQRTPPGGVSHVVAVAAGSRHSLALRADGTVAAWGDNSRGQKDVPAGLTNVVAISAGDYHSLALKADGAVVGWGAGRPGTVGPEDYGQATIPSGLSNVVAIAAGRYHSLALKADGTAVGWGDNYRGQTLVPAGGTNLTAIAAGRYHSLFLKVTTASGPQAESGLFPIPRPARNGATAGSR